MTVYFTNINCQLSADPRPTSGSNTSAGKTGSLPSSASFDSQLCLGQSSLFSIYPNQKPGSDSGWNRGTN